MRLGLVVIEGVPVPVQLVEDALPGRAVYRVDGVDEGARFMGPDARRGAGDELVEVGFGSRAHREAHDERERRGVLRHVLSSLAWQGQVADQPTCARTRTTRI